MTSTDKKKKNRLSKEKSPYLLQHEDNPVDWYPWGEEAFDKAKKEDKPVFLSIGYSTCHWCHVMAHESFEDDEVAILMNEVFVNIKVDREERPDIDGVYMEVAQMITGRGGWPLTIIMTPDKQPFFAGTYIPKESRYSSLGMKELIPRIKEIWESDRDNINETTSRIKDALSETRYAGEKEDLSLDSVDLAFSHLSQRFDEKQGGFGSAPKFPSPHNLMLILRYWKRTGDEWALFMVEKTLQAMRNGGIFDHIGFGFHRYSTDEKWLLPHFEKMLYDQASLMMAYTEVYQITKKQEYADIVREIFEYVTRDLTGPEGAFYSAEDADSEGEEGKFYTWTKSEIEDIINDKNEASIFMQAFNIHEEGNFEDEATREMNGLNIPHLKEKADLDTDLGITREELKLLLDKIKTNMFVRREMRVRPSLDDKILTDWNGFMIAALSKAGAILGDAKFIETSERALKFILDTMLDDERRLYHRYKDGEIIIQAFLDDYAYLVWALLETYEATFKPEYLEQAIDLTLDMLEHFWDEEEGGLYFTGTYSEDLLVRKKDVYDGAMPSGNSVAALNLIRLARFLGDTKLEEKAAETVRAFSGIVPRAYSGFTMLLTAVEFAYGDSYEIVIAGNPDSEDTQEMIRAVRDQFIPNRVILLKGTEHQSKEVSQLAPYTKFHDTVGGKATAHVCIDYNCKLPTNDVAQLLKLIGVTEMASS
ncbi:MAG: thioredoxin domain-containing protein [Candidatus Thorarchaeota archaeon]